jgi:soluble lytic murein transglycosylase-like protein
MKGMSVWLGLAVWCVLSMPGCPVQATSPTWWVQSAMETCEALGVPGRLAVAVILTESRGQPYAIRVNQGTGYAVFPATYAAGVQAVTAAVTRAPNTDLGLMQVNYAIWGPRLGLTPAQLLHPTVNLWAGCTVLKQALTTGGALWQQLGRYHSPTPARQYAYARRVMAWLSILAK